MQSANNALGSFAGPENWLRILAAAAMILKHTWEARNDLLFQNVAWILTELVLWWTLICLWR